MLSSEKDESEITGATAPTRRREIWTAFGLPGQAPAPEGIAPHSPRPTTAGWPASGGGAPRLWAPLLPLPRVPVRGGRPSTSSPSSFHRRGLGLSGGGALHRPLLHREHGQRRDPRESAPQQLLALPRRPALIDERRARSTSSTWRPRSTPGPTATGPGRGGPQATSTSPRSPGALRDCAWPAVGGPAPFSGYDLEVRAASRRSTGAAGLAAAASSGRSCCLAGRTFRGRALVGERSRFRCLERLE